MESPVIDGLKTKSFPVDIWTTREHLCLISAVSQSGDKNWNVVSKTIQQLTTEKYRPQDWYSTKNCALQYARLIEQVEDLKKKKEKDMLSIESNQQYLLKTLRQKRIEELKEILEEEKANFYKLKKEVHMLESNQFDNKLHQYWNDMMKEQDRECEEQARLQEFLKEREERLKLAVKAQSLKASAENSVVPSKLQISQGSPKNEFEQTVGTEMVNKKSNDPNLKEEVPVREISLKKEPLSETAAPESATINLFPPDRDTGQEKEMERPEKKESSLELKEYDEVIKLPEDSFETTKCDSSYETNLPLDYTSNLNVEMREDEPDVGHEEVKKILEANDGTCEGEEKEVSQQENVHAKEKPKFQQIQENKTKDENSYNGVDEELEVNKDEDLDEEKVIEEEKEVEVEGEGEGEDGEEEEIIRKKEEDKEIRKQKWRKKNIATLTLPKEETKAKKFLESDHAALFKKEESERPHDTELRKSGADAVATATFFGEFQSEREVEQKTPQKDVKDEYEFDDDASRESTDVKDYTYSRSDRRKFSLSENVMSPVISESTPSSPASTSYGDDPEVEKLHRAWKRSITLLWNDIAAHKIASIFLKPITEDKVPGYHAMVYRPLDLMSIKRSIENGTIRTTLEFQRDVMLMFLNAKMYNNRYHNIYRMAQEMMLDVMDTIEEFIQAQMLSKVVESPQKSLRRETRESSAKRSGEDVKRKRDDKDEKQIKRRKLV